MPLDGQRDALMPSSLTLDVVLNHMSDMVFIMAANSEQEFRYAKMNSSAMSASGLSSYAYGATFHDVVEPNEADVLYAQYLRAFRSRRSVSFLLDHEGQIGESVLSPIIAPDGHCTHVIGIVRDITERYRREETLIQQALHDSLTGMLNRHGLENGLKGSFREARRTATLVSLLMVDIDHLKEVNDTFGHVIGDLYIRDAAKRLHSALRTEDLVARVGGDEFLVAANIVNQADIVILAERILTAFAAPWPHEDINLNMSVSIGVAFYPLNGATAWDVITAADHALYKAKHAGGQRYEFAEGTV